MVELPSAATKSCSKARKALRAIRARLNIRGPLPVYLIPNSAQAPTLQGRSGYWTTPSGKTIVQYPAAYRWPKAYHPSTRELVIGADWLQANYPELSASLLTTYLGT